MICFQCRRLQAHIKSETHFIFIMPESLATFIGKVKLKTSVKFPCASHFHPEVVWNRHWSPSRFFLIVTVQVGFCQCVTRSKPCMKPPVLFRWGAPSGSWARQWILVKIKLYGLYGVWTFKPCCHLPRITGSPLEAFCSDLEHLGFISACCEVCLEVPAVRAPRRVHVLLVTMVLFPMA